MKFLRVLDLVVLAAALIVFLVADLPLSAWFVVAIVWFALRVVNGLVEQRVEATVGDKTRVMSLQAVAIVSRAWLPGIAALLLGLLTDRETGLAAVLLAVVVFTVHFVVGLVLRFTAPDAGPSVSHPTEGHSS